MIYSPINIEMEIIMSLRKRNNENLAERKPNL